MFWRRTACTADPFTLSTNPNPPRNDVKDAEPEPHAVEASPWPEPQVTEGSPPAESTSATDASRGWGWAKAVVDNTNNLLHPFQAVWNG